MGVDASYIYGYMTKKGKVEWDIAYLKNKFNLNDHLTGYLKKYTYKDLIEWLENDEVDDWDDIAGIMGIKNSFAYDEEYLYFTHFDIIKRFPKFKLEDFDALINEYAKEAGVKNYDVFKWDEFGYFD